MAIKAVNRAIHKFHLQALNRYSYVQNNPLSYTDPSGYFIDWVLEKTAKLVKRVVQGIQKVFKKTLQAIGRVLNAVPGVSTVVGVAISLSCIPCAKTYFQVLAGLNTAVSVANGASLGDVLVGAAVGYVTADLGGSLGSALSEGALQVAGHYVGAAIAGGIAAKALGGRFKDGLAGGLLGAAARHALGDFGESKAESDRSNGAGDNKDNAVSFDDAKQALRESGLVPDNILDNPNILRDRTSEYGLFRNGRVRGVLSMDEVAKLEAEGWIQIEGSSYRGGVINIFKQATFSGHEAHVGLFGRQLTGVQNLIQTIYHEYQHYIGVPTHGGNRSSFAWDRWGRREGAALNPVFDR